MKNHLANESSPYLLQHAENPVDWYPWGQEAFDKAAAMDRPIFLSIGYSSCHWCHVMAHQVFENQEVAELLNENFISIKLDREERPDLDQLYMKACIMMNGSGGWPLSIFMTAEKQPFFSGSYFPPDSFMRIARQIIDLWDSGRHDINRFGRGFMKAMASVPNAENWDNSYVPAAFAQLKDSFDAKNGGFGQAPKFPSPHMLMFLQRYAMATGEHQALDMSARSLHSMSLGGIHDHVGGGFFRYSTDDKFLIPHFEKMLYDNAMLLIAYAEHGRLDMAEKIWNFCRRELLSAEGAFYSSLDADSQGEEGSYYLFTVQDVESILGQDAGRYCKLFDISQQGNFEGKNLPNLLKSGELSSDDLAFAEAANQKLLEGKAGRESPEVDEKILLSSNSLMLAALASYARLSGREDILKSAVSLAEFLLTKMQHDGRYYASYLGTLSKHPATSDDYAYLAWGLLKLHQASLDNRWLEASRETADSLLELFSSKEGMLWMSGKDVEDLPLRLKSSYDGALPSGNSIAAGVFQRLFTLTSDEKYLNARQAIKSDIAAYVAGNPGAFTSLLSSVLLEEQALKVELPKSMAGLLRDFYPFSSFLPSENSVAMVCTSSACLPPVESITELEELLKGSKHS